MQIKRKEREGEIQGGSKNERGGRERIKGMMQSIYVGVLRRLEQGYKGYNSM